MGITHFTYNIVSLAITVTNLWSKYFLYLRAWILQYNVCLYVKRRFYTRLYIVVRSEFSDTLSLTLSLPKYFLHIKQENILKQTVKNSVWVPGTQLEAVKRLFSYKRDELWNIIFFFSLFPVSYFMFAYCSCKCVPSHLSPCKCARVNACSRWQTTCLLSISI